MTSRLAKQAIEEMWNEGLHPSFEDIIHLNALGLEIEKGDDMYDFSVLPRTAFIGDYVFYEPTIAKRLWLEQASNLVSQEDNSLLYLILFVCHYEVNEYPSLKDTKHLADVLSDFVEKVLLHSTLEQLFGVVDYLLNGNDPTSDEDYRYNKDKQSIYEVPKEISSVSKQLLCQGAIYGLTKDVMEQVTIKTLDRMIDVACIQKGSDILKNRRAQNSGKFYVSVAKIKEQLKKDNNENGKE